MRKKNDGPNRDATTHRSMNRRRRGRPPAGTRCWRPGSPARPRRGRRSPRRRCGATPSAPWSRSPPSAARARSSPPSSPTTAPACGSSQSYIQTNQHGKMKQPKREKKPLMYAKMVTGSSSRIASSLECKAFSIAAVTNGDVHGSARVRLVVVHPRLQQLTMPMIGRCHRPRKKLCMN